MKKVHFYHIYCDSSHWTEILKEHFETIEKSKLLFEKIYIGIVGKEENRKLVKSFLETIPICFEILEEQDSGYEQITLRNIKKKKQELVDSFIFYAHTKNARHSPKDKKFFKRGERWRRVMNFYTIKKWQDCITILQNKDVESCGPFLVPSKNETRPQHYGGNFWWLYGKAVQKLKDIEYNDRFDAEMWLGRSEITFFDLCPEYNGIDHFYMFKLNRRYLMYKRLKKKFLKLISNLSIRRNIKQ